MHQRVKIKSHTQFRMCKNGACRNSTVFSECFMCILKSFLLTGGHTSYRWGLVTDGDSTCTRLLPKKSRREPVSNLWLSRDHQGAESTIWSTWLKVHVCELQGCTRGGLLVFFDTIEQIHLIMST